MQCTQVIKFILMKTKIFLIFIAAILFFSFTVNSYGSSADSYPNIGNIESLLFGHSYPEQAISKRLVKVEKSIFGEVYLKDNLDRRLKRIEESNIGYYSIHGEMKEANENNLLPGINNNNGYENLETRELTDDKFVEAVYGFINDERTSMGLLPLSTDQPAILTARSHATDIIAGGYLSHCNLMNQCPDERYTLNGGNGTVLEIINAFEKDNPKEKIKQTELLAKQLVQAITLNPDDSQVLFSPYLNYVGCSTGLSKDNQKFVSVINFVTNGGDFKPIKQVINWGEKLNIEGKILKPYKFKAISLSYEEASKSNRQAENSFDIEDLKPFFPPQDYIAYGDTSRTNLLKILKGVGVLGAIGAAPFTGGASAVLAPVLIQSLQNGQPREIPLKGGVKVNKNQEFSGEIELSYQGRSGLYYVSVLGELPGVGFPVVLSRRTVRVNSPLFPVSYLLDKNLNGILR